MDAPNREPHEEKPNNGSIFPVITEEEVMTSLTLGTTLLEADILN